MRFFVWQKVEGRRQEFEIRGRREFGCLAEAAMGLVCAAENHAGGFRDAMRTRELLGLAFELGSEGLGNGARILFDLIALIPPGGFHGVDHVEDTRGVATRLRREIGADKEGTAVRGADRVERPAPVPVQAKRGLHINLVDIGSLFAIDLDANERVVHGRRDFRIFERFAFHHVAPMTGAVPDGDEERAILPSREFQGFLAPRQPVHRVVLVLAEIGARLQMKPVAGILLGVRLGGFRGRGGRVAHGSLAGEAGA